MAAAAVDFYSREDVMFKWSKENTEKFIRLRQEHADLFTGAKNTALYGWRFILEKMELSSKVTPGQAKKKWDNLKKKYKECKHPGSGEGLSGGKPTAETWPWFVLMDEMLGQRPSICPPVLVSSLQEEPRPGCSSVEPTQEAEQEERTGTEQSERPRKRKNKSDPLLELLKEDMARQKEWEERRDAEDRARSDRLFSLLEKMVDKM